MNRYLNMVRLVVRSIVEWDEVYLTNQGRIITGAEWDILIAYDGEALSPWIGDETLIGSCWAARLHMDVDDE